MKTFFPWALLCLFLTPQLAMANSSASLPANPLKVSVELSATKAKTGDLIAYRASLTNVGKSALEIPADTTKYFKITGEYAAPSAALSGQPQPHDGEKKVRAKTRWQALLPGESVHLSGTFREVFKECATGCQSGSYRLVASLDVPKNEELKFGQVIPGFSRAVTEASVIPTRQSRGTAGIELHVSNPMWRSPTQLDFQGTLRNTTNQPVWVPNPEKLPVTCRFRVVTPTQTVFMRHAPVTKIVSRFNEREGVLLHGGDEAYFSYQCKGIQEQSILSAKKVYVGAEVTFVREFYPVTNVEASDFLKGRIRSSQVQVK